MKVSNYLIMDRDTNKVWFIVTNGTVNEEALDVCGSYALEITESTTRSMLAAKGVMVNHHANPDL